MGWIERTATTQRCRPGAITRRGGTVAFGLSAASIVLLASGCVDTTGPPFPLIEATEFAPSLGIDLAQMTRVAGGIYLADVEDGTGAELQSDHRVEVSYSLYLADGTLVERRDSLRFRIGCRQVVPGLDAGIRGMKVNGLRWIIVPGRFGYGSSPPPGVEVPFGAVLVYNVEAASSVPVDPEKSCPGPIS